MQQNKIKVFKDFKHLARLYYGGTVFVAFDTETTGLHSDSAFLMEIGAVKFDAEGVISTFDTLIKPPVEVPSMLVELTHITPLMLQDCPPASKVIPGFLNFIGGATLVAHNAQFDVGFINAELERMTFPLLKNTVVDTLSLSRWAYPNFLREEGRGKGLYRLQSLAQRFDIEVKAAHRADDDARVCMELFKKIVKDTMNRQKDYEAKETLSLFSKNTSGGQENLAFN